MDHGLLVYDKKPAVAEEGLQGLQRRQGEIDFLPLDQKMQNTVEGVAENIKTVIPVGAVQKTGFSRSASVASF